MIRCVGRFGSCQIKGRGRGGSVDKHIEPEPAIQPKSTCLKAGDDALRGDRPAHQLVPVLLHDDDCWVD